MNRKLVRQQVAVLELLECTSRACHSSNVKPQVHAQESHLLCVDPGRGMIPRQVILDNVNSFDVNIFNSVELAPEEDDDPQAWVVFLVLTGRDLPV